MYKLTLLVPLTLLGCSTSAPADPHGTGGGSMGGQPTAGVGGSSGDGGRSGGSSGNGGMSAGQPHDGGAAGKGTSVPDFGDNVYIFEPSLPATEIQAKLDALHETQFKNQFGEVRAALLFKPGTYSLNVPVGYYTQVLGLGRRPDDVVIEGMVRSSGITNGNATLCFWRGVENLTIEPRPSGQANLWAVSQGASFRSVHVRGRLALADTGYSSGGFIANTKIDDIVTSGSQQQYFVRNSDWTAWQGGVWNMVFSGVSRPPSGSWPAAPYTVVEKTPYVNEKPHLFVDEEGGYFVHLPKAKRDSTGSTWPNPDPSDNVGLAAFYVAHEGDSAADINVALEQGKHLLLTPGIYRLTEPLSIARAGTIVLGIGLPTLIAESGTPAIRIADVGGVRVAGVIVEAGAMLSPSLVEVGPSTASASHAADPSVLSDLYCRVGGTAPGKATSCVVVNSSDVVGDNWWLWRADHGAGAGWATNPSEHGLIVNGANVVVYGLFVEHFQGYQTLWNGNGGRVYFYQSELPYDPPTQSEWQHDGVNGFASYKVAENVTTHEAWGMGVYSAFRTPVAADNAFEAPTATGVSLQHLVTVWLNGDASSAIHHVLNGQGVAATQANRRATFN